MNFIVLSKIVLISGLWWISTLQSKIKIDFTNLWYVFPSWINGHQGADVHMGITRMNFGPGLISIFRIVSPITAGGGAQVIHLPINRIMGKKVYTYIIVIQIFGNIFITNRIFITGKSIYGWFTIEIGKDWRQHELGDRPIVQISGKSWSLVR